MMLENENDLSAQADALAMKYLTDEQLTELAKRSTRSPNGRWKHTADFERMLASTPLGGATGRSNNNTMYGGNHISFASRKYLEKYGLLEATGGSGVKQNGGRQVRETVDSSLKDERRSKRPSKTRQERQEERGSFCENKGGGGRQADRHAQAQHQPPVQQTPLNQSYPPMFPPRTPEVSPRAHAQPQHSNSSPEVAAAQQLEDSDVCVEADNTNPTQCGSGSGDKKILDIRRLKELPKLL